MIDAASVMTMDMTKAVLMIWLSIPRASMVAAAFCSFAGEMTLASPPPMAVTAVTISASTLRSFEVRRWYL